MRETDCFHQLGGKNRSALKPRLLAMVQATKQLKLVLFQPLLGRGEKDCLLLMKEPNSVVSGEEQEQNTHF